MIKITTPLPLLLLLLGCGNEGASPKNAIPANSATLKIDGVPFPVDMSRSEAIFEASSEDLFIVLKASDGRRVIMGVEEFNRRPEKFTFRLPTNNRIDIDEFSVGGRYTSSHDCNPKNTEMEILTYDETRRTVSGRFSAKVCEGFGASTTKPSRMVTDGQFNLPFRTQ